MEKLNKLPVGSREKFFLSDIYFQGKLLAQGIKSKLILNDIKYTEPLLIFYPSKENFHNIAKNFEFEIKGYFEYVDGEKAGEIHIPKAYTINSEHTTYASSWEECIVQVIPVEICQKHRINGQENAEKAKIVFSLTDNKMVNPWGIIERNFTGEVKSDLKSSVILNFGDNWNARFEKHYHYVSTIIEEVKGCFSSNHLALTFGKDNYLLSSLNEIKTLSDLLDKLLWYLSFGSRQRTTWIKWTALIGNEIVEYYRKISVPEKLSEYDEPLVDRSSFQEFLQHCLAYLTRPNSLNLYLPIVYLVNADRPGKTIEAQFLSLFMSLEALLNLYAESREKKKHFTNESWKPFYAYIKRAIEEFPNINDKDKELLVQKLGIFNQPSMKTLYNDFCNNMTIDNSDLWPVYGTDIDLSYIRNKLIHGNRFEYETFLSIANEHLRWTVERCLLAVLDWKGITDVNREGLRKYTAYHDWESYYKKE